ncbi:MAG: hypothetical protein ACM358_03925 [Gemmatimonadota bacterium]
MLPFSSARWRQLHHAFGTAKDIPGLLAHAPVERRPSHRPDTIWFELWSALCRQGAAYSASYAAVPHLVRIAKLPAFRFRYDPLLLIASIELARLEHRAPAIPEDLAADYVRAVAEAKGLAQAAVVRAWDEDSWIAFAGSAAVLRGDVARARAIFDARAGL